VKSGDQSPNDEVIAENCRYLLCRTEEDSMQQL
jgi:hypothetical protein